MVSNATFQIQFASKGLFKGFVLIIRALFPILSVKLPPVVCL